MRLVELLPIRDCEAGYGPVYESYFHYQYAQNQGTTYEGGSKIPCNHLFSLHMGAFIQRWQYLHQV